MDKLRLLQALAAVFTIVTACVSLARLFGLV
jgi:hypothetical protein